MSATSTQPPVHHHEENYSRGQAFTTWLKAQYALYILVALLLIATVTRGSIFWGGTNLTNLLLQMSIIGVVVLAELIVVLTGGIDISVGSALGLAAVVSAGLFGGPSVLLGLVIALVIGGAVGASERMARRVPRARTVHRHPGHARPGSRPRLRLRQRHPDHSEGGVDVRHHRADHGAGLPSPGHHLDRGGGGYRLRCSTAPSGVAGSTPSAPTRRRPAAPASRSRRPCGRSTSWPACSSVSAAGCSCAASPPAPRPPAT